MTEKMGLVLCVDDEPNVLRSLQWLLQKDFIVKTADGGSAGLELVKQHDFDVIVSDQRMPGMMGSEFLGAAAKISPRSMRILLTGYSDLQAILRSVNEGEIFRFINKPWDINDLPKVVLEAVQLSKTQAPEPLNPQSVQANPFENQEDNILVVDDDGGMVDMVRAQVPSPEKVVYAKNIAEAMSIMENQRIGIIVSDTRVGNMDTTRMLKVLKHDSPAVVTLVYTGESDADDVITLINQGQIFRFIPKPSKPQVLDMALKAAAAKRAQFREHPEVLKRHSAQELPAGERQLLLDDIQKMIKNVAPEVIKAGTSNSGGSGLFGGMKKLFGK